MKRTARKERENSRARSQLHNEDSDSCYCMLTCQLHGVSWRKVAISFLLFLRSAPPKISSSYLYHSAAEHSTEANTATFETTREEVWKSYKLSSCFHRFPHSWELTLINSIWITETLSIIFSESILLVCADNAHFAQERALSPLARNFIFHSATNKNEGNVW